MKLEVTPELAKVLKTMRVQNGVSARDVASHLGKSPSYVSKLEGGGVHSIDKDCLVDLLKFVSSGAGIYEVALPNAARLLENTVDVDRLVNQTWLMQLDVIERPVSIPFDMTRDIAANLHKMQVSSKDLASYINANLDSQMPASFPANQFTVIEYDGRPRLLASVDIPESLVGNVVAGETLETGYYVVYNIVYAMFRMQNFPDEMDKLPPEKVTTVLRCTAAYMDRWGIHSLVGFSHFISSDDFIQYQLPLASGMSGIVGHIAEQLDEIASIDSLSAINQLNVFSETLQWDPAFALKIAGIPFSSLGDMSFANKQRLLHEIIDLVDRYDNMDELERRLESY